MNCQPETKMSATCLLAHLCNVNQEAIISFPQRPSESSPTFKWLQQCLFYSGECLHCLSLVILFFTLSPHSCISVKSGENQYFIENMDHKVHWWEPRNSSNDSCVFPLSPVTFRKHIFYINFLSFQVQQLEEVWHDLLTSVPQQKYIHFIHFPLPPLRTMICTNPLVGQWRSLLFHQCATVSRSFI